MTVNLLVSAISLRSPLRVQLPGRNVNCHRFIVAHDCHNPAPVQVVGAEDVPVSKIGPDRRTSHLKTMLGGSALPKVPWG